MTFKEAEGRAKNEGWEIQPKNGEFPSIIFNAASGKWCYSDGSGTYGGSEEFNDQFDWEVLW